MYKNLFKLSMGMFGAVIFSSCMSEQQPKNPALASRKIEHNVDPIFVNRWSTYAMSGEPITQDLVMQLFEAARWAPSAFNDQPWRFIYAQRETPEWNGLFNLLVPFNQSWAKNAAMLVLIISKKTYGKTGKPYRTHTYDTGAAWMSLALQGSMMGLAVHGMEGFDYDKARKDLNISNDYDIEAMCAVGKLGTKADLPKDMQDEDQAASQRMPVEQLVYKGTFKE